MIYSAIRNASVVSKILNTEFSPISFLIFFPAKNLREYYHLLRELKNLRPLIDLSSIENSDKMMRLIQDCAAFVTQGNSMWLSRRIHHGLSSNHGRYNMYTSVIIRRKRSQFSYLKVMLVSNENTNIDTPKCQNSFFYFGTCIQKNLHHVENVRALRLPCTFRPTILLKF